MSNYKIPEKPKGMKQQMDVLWEVVCNDLVHRAAMTDWKIKIILAITLTTLGVVIAKGF